MPRFIIIITKPVHPIVNINKFLFLTINNCLRATNHRKFLIIYKVHLTISEFLLFKLDLNFNN